MGGGQVIEMQGQIGVWGRFSRAFTLPHHTLVGVFPQGAILSLTFFFFLVRPLSSAASERDYREIEKKQGTVSEHESGSGVAVAVPGTTLLSIGGALLCLSLSTVS